MQEVIAADPFILLDRKSGYYYLYSTNDSDGKAFSIHKSKDKLNWKFVDYALDLNDEKNWGRDWFWAPECYYNPNNDYYYLFYSARCKKNITEELFLDRNYDEDCRLGVAISKSPEGPFINMTNRPIDFNPYDFDYIDVEGLGINLFEESNNNALKRASKGNYISIIDANLLIEDERIILYFSRCCYRNCKYDEKFNRYIEASNIAYVELDMAWWYDKEARMEPQIKEEYKSYDSNGHRRDKFKTVISYELENQEWENAHVYDYRDTNGLKKNRRWSEGSSIFKVNYCGDELYAITYSCNLFEARDYSVGIAFSKSPYGPFKKYPDNPVIAEKNGVCSLGHGSVLIENDKIYYFLHGRTEVEKPRVLTFTEINVNNRYVTCGDIKICNLVTKI